MHQSFDTMMGSDVDMVGSMRGRSWTQPKRVVLATSGSLGDLHPFLALGHEMQRRGHSVVIATMAAYRERVESKGLELHAVRPNIDPNDPETLRRALDRKTGGEYILRDVAFGCLRESFEDSAAAAAGADLIVTHPVTFGMQLVARASGRPWASVALAPLSYFSATDPSVFAGMPMAYAIAGMGPWAQRAILGLADRGTSRWQQAYRDIETELGLDHGPNPVFAGQHSPHLSLALFSRVLAPPQGDWPASAKIMGFPFARYDEGFTARVAGFMADGEPPVVFTLGSAAVGVAGDFFDESIAAIGRLGVRALLLVGGDRANHPREPLPANILAVPYAPHAMVFPRASVVVHQGGIGTTAEAMRAGRPMLVVPYGHDQPDHARRLCRLGVARSVPREKYCARVAYREIRALLDDEILHARARAMGNEVGKENGVRAACDELDALLVPRTASAHA